MPVGPSSSPADITGIGSQQVNQKTQAVTTPKNLGQLAGEVMQWNPDVGVTMIRNWINESYRSIIDRRMWYGLMTRGQIVTPQVYTTGTVTATLNSQTVTGTNTAWTSALAKQQLRIGFSTGFYNIKSIDSPTSMTLDLPWGNPTVTSVGYSVMQVWVTLGNNIKYILEAVNQRQGYKLFVGMPQAVLNQYDVWRTSTGWSWGLFAKEPTVDGQPQYEIYPAPTFQQAFPFLAYIQPPELVLDTDFPYPFFRHEAIINPAIAKSLVFGGAKNNKYYDPNTAKFMLAQGEAAVQAMMMTDDCLYPKDMIWDYSKYPMSQAGASWLQNHAGGWDEP